MTRWNAPIFARKRFAAIFRCRRAWVLALGVLLAFSRAASAEVWTLSWNPATTYEDGTPILGKTVSYSVYWSTDPGTTAPMTPLATGVTQTSAPFDPVPKGMPPGQTIYFRLKTALNTGETSGYSAALPWIVPGTAPDAPGAPANLTISGIGASAPQGASAAGGPPPPPTAWRLVWDPVTAYADGRPLPAGRTVRYAVYWSRDPSLAAGSLIPLSSATSGPSAEFDPRAEGMSDNERIYFVASATLDTGAESSLSGGLGWRASNRGPAPPAKGKIVQRK